MTTQRPVSDCSADARETHQSWRLSSITDFLCTFSTPLTPFGYSPKFFVMSFQQRLPGKDKSVTRLGEGGGDVVICIFLSFFFFPPWKKSDSSKKVDASLNVTKVIHYHSNLKTHTISKIITPELIDSFAFICNVKCLINKLNILQVHKNDDNL